jgi:hypothetical protein
MKKVLLALKHAFIPHHHNDYKPHFFREYSIAAILATIIILFGLSAGTSLYIKNTDMIATVLPAVLADLTNEARVANNQLALRRSTTLDQAASLKAQDMAKNSYFAHTSPAGLTPWHWFDKAGYIFIYAGENLAIDFTESVDVENAWLNSPGHRANILSSRFTEIGIATFDGIYNGRATTYVVQMFGTPAFAKTTVTEAPKTAPVTSPKPSVKPAPKPVLKPVAVAPTVKGEAIEESKLETITETPEFVAVKNNAEVEETPVVAPPPPKKYSAWHERFLFQDSKYVDTAYKILMGIVFVALIIMMVVEIKRQHPKNILYGVLILIILIVLMYLNRSLFMFAFV